METGIVFNIQRFCVNDGPGIRTSVFLKGCPLSCLWCHNPEGLKPRKQLMFSAEKCRLCGACAAVCSRHAIEGTDHRILREGCKACGKCADTCPAGALEIAGREMTAQAVMETVLRDRLFYEQSGGGMTLTGGEPAMQPEFAICLAQSAKENGIHTAMETSGFCTRDVFRTLAPEFDLILFDLKETDPVRHREYTGRDNGPILENLAFLREAGIPVILRCPVIPGFNDREEHFRSIALTAEKNGNILQIDLEPYHPLGLAKAVKLGRIPDPRLPVHTVPKETCAEWAECIRRYTDRKVVIA